MAPGLNTGIPSWSRRAGWLTLAISGLLPLLGGLPLATLFSEQKWFHEPLHSTIEAAGAAVAILVAALLLFQDRHASAFSKSRWVATSLLVMGVLDGFHALLHVSPAFFWSRALPTLLGGLLFALVWLPDSWERSAVGRHLPWVGSASAVSLGLALIAFPSSWPIMFGAEGYSFGAKAINVTGGLGFIAAGAYFARDYARAPSKTDVVFASHCLLFGVASMLFAFSHMWGAVWWYFHFLRLGAYLIVLGYAVRYFADVIERSRRAQESAVTDARNILRVALQAGQMGSWINDVKNQRLIWSEEQDKLFGLEPGKFDGSFAMLLSLIHPLDRARMKAAFEETERTGKHYECTYRIVRPTGEVRWIMSRGRVIRAPDGTIERIVGAAADVTKIKEREERLTRLEHRVAVAEKGAAIGLFEWDVEARELFFTPGFYTMLGYSPEAEAPADTVSHFTQLLHHEDKENFWRRLDDILQGGDIDYEDEFQLRHHNGSYRWILARGVVQRDGTGAAKRLTGVNIDVTERKQAELSTQRFKTAFLHSKVGLGVADAEMRFIEVNQAYCDIVGYSPEELYGMRVWELNHPDDNDDNRAQIAALLAGTIPSFVIEKRYVRKDGTSVWVRVSVTATRDARGNATSIVAMAEDVTARKLAEESLKRQAEELARSNAELEQFAYISSHDLKEPLRNVRTYVELLRHRYKGKLGPDADTYIAYASESAARMQQLIDSVLTYSRVGKWGDIEPVDLNDACERVITNVRAAIESSGASITVSPLPVVMGHPVEVGQLLQNLIQNALTYRSKDREPHIEISARTDDGLCELSIRDNGIGIEPRYQRQIFEMFKRLHSWKEYPGTGIGLALCKKIVERLNGRIWVESEPGKGSVFRITLPLATESDRPDSRGRGEVEAGPMQMSHGA